jgi:dipeptidyl aminopeptidase/acylaminoacyl peptidase
MAFNPDAFAKLPALYQPTLSHQRDRVAYYDQNLDLQLLHVYTGERRTLTAGGAVQDDVLPFAWSRDGRFIFISRSENGLENYDVYRVDVETGDVVPLWQNPDVAAYVLDAYDDDVLIGSTQTGIFNLARIPATPTPATLHTQPQSLTEFPYPIHDARYSEDGRYILVAGNHTNSPRNVDVWMLRSTGANLERLLSNGENCQDGFSHWRGRLIAVHSDVNGMRQTGVLDYKQQTLRWLSPLKGHYWPGQLSPDGKRLLAYLNAEAAITATVFSTRGRGETPLQLPDGIYHTGQWLNNDEILLAQETDVTLTRLLVYNLQTHTFRVVHEPDYGDLDPTQFAPHEYVRYTTWDNQQVPALLYRPRTPGATPRPAVVYVHGGPTAQHFRNFDPTTQMLVSAGFVVLMPNVRGSTGYSAEWRDTIALDWGGGDLQDVVAAADYLGGLPDVDGERIGIFGGSYGGYLANMAMTKYGGAFKAGLSFNGITDLKLLDTTTDPRYRMIFRRYMGKPEEYGSLWHARSPTTHAATFAGTLLLLHGENDPRIPVSQIYALKDALEAAGHMLGEGFDVQILPDAGHIQGDAAGTELAMFRIREFFLRVLMNTA